MATNRNEVLNEYGDTIVRLLLLALVLVIYWQVTGFQFVNLDDNKYVYENPAVLGGLSGESISWAFSTFFFANWHPLTWISHQFDVSVFGLNPGAHHSVNVIFHLINTLLSLELFRRLTDSFWKGAMIAALFAVHPLHVESVAWISERKDVLSTMFWLLSMLAYLRFANDKAVNSGKTNSEKEKADRGTAELIISGLSSRYFLLALAMFAFGLMAKPMLVTLPFVLLLLDFWPLERLRKMRDVIHLSIEKLPFFVLTVVSVLLTIEAQSVGGAVRDIEAIGFGTRLINACVSYATYLVQLVYPVNLSAYYPYEFEFPIWKILGSLSLIIFVSGFCLWQLTKRKYLITGWLWFLGTLIPVIGLMQVGGQAHADRYTYVPYFGLFLIVVLGASELSERIGINGRILSIVALAVVIVFSYLSFQQVGIWQNSETMLKHSISVTRDNYVLTQNYCHELTAQNRLEEAEKQCRDSISFNPRHYLAYATLGNIQIKKKQFALAEANYKKSLELGPAAHQYLFNLATSQSLQGKPFEAETTLREASSKMPPKAFPGVWTTSLIDLAGAFERDKEYEKASENYIRALSISPQRLDTRASLATSLFKAGKYEEAEKQIDLLLTRAPKQPEAHELRGTILLKLGKREEAIEAFEIALAINPGLESARRNLKAARGAQ